MPRFDPPPERVALESLLSPNPNGRSACAFDPEPLTEGIVHIWRVDLGQLRDTDVSPADALADEERERGERLRTETLRRRFALSRGLLRCILGRYLQQAPERIRFRYGAQGKPELAEQTRHGTPAFNLSHSRDQWALAIGACGTLGIDIECWRPLRALEALAARCLADEEFAVWSRLPADQQGAALFRLWTLKEAFLKGVGCGISVGLRQCAFDPLASPPRLLRCPESLSQSPAAKDWSFVELDMAPDCSGAVASDQAITTLREYRLEVRSDAPLRQ
ncbi:MAG: 4'-phosphopantetheinyl transferase superfamily protein [Methylotetracoccus sp.]